MNRTRAGVLVTVTLLAGLVAALGQLDSAGAAAADPPTIEQADKLFTDKNYKQAAEAYEAILAAKPKHAKWRHASERVILSQLRLQLFDDAIASAKRYITRCEGTPFEARAERLTGNLYMLLPHWGTRAGGKFHRGQWKQGIQLRSYRHDKSKAMAHLERARDLYAKWDADFGDPNQPGAPVRPDGAHDLTDEEYTNWHNERVECLFDLAGVAGRFGIYENQWFYWYHYWGERDDERADTAGEQDFDEYHNQWQLQRKRPIGLRIGPDGQPIFPTKPKAYAKDLNDDQKILYLLDEARRLDRTKDHQYTALSYYRQAMLARARFGLDRLNNYGSMYYHAGKRPLQEELKAFNPWELKDDESLVLAGGSITKVTLPNQWNVMGLLRVVVGDYAKAGLAPEGQYAIALYHQTRQQYTTALEQYAVLKETYPQDQWSSHANTQISRIRQGQVRISQTGVQLPGEPAKLQLSYRNTSKVWFVARRIDHIGFMEHIRNQKIDKFKGLPHFWSLRNWHNYFVHGHYHNQPIYDIAAKYVGKEVARWSDEVKDDGTHRYAQAMLQTPLDKRGAYLVYAYLSEPPKEHADLSGRAALKVGHSRSVYALTDLAIVDKKVQQGTLYFVADARTGAPVANTQLKVLEVWNTYDRAKRKSIYHKAMHELKTDAEGMALLKRPNRQRGQLHLLADATGHIEGKGADKIQPRTAWSGMSYWSHYSPSRMRNGLFAYCITDRPVYRPNQTVRYKVWLRQMREGLFQNQPDRDVRITIYDPRGNKVKVENKRSDQFGGLDGDFTLGDEPRLGVYRVYVHGQGYVGGQNFRVEEYKKPEFEVTVTPSENHTKLGEKLTALIKADYYFGAPVADAKVKYKVFREEYRHTYYAPGAWDWLYGPGYGYAWYSYDWFPWWGRMRSCWAPPHWWWGYYGYPAPTPVRELVKQGEGRIDGDGKFEVQIDTAAALRDHPDQDHRYVIQAEVRDASRRVITGEGAVKVTRQSYYAFVQSRKGYYNPGEEMFFTVRCLTPDNKPIETEGVVTVSEVVFGGPDNAHIKETQLEQFTLKTDERGIGKFQLRHERSGQLKIKFASPDQWSSKPGAPGIVEGFGLVWVAGRDFDGKLYRFNDLELITDKRTYQPGEVAHVMVNTKRSNSYVLFSDNVDNSHLLSWKLLHIPGKSMLIDVPVKKGQSPNFFIEATTVSNTRVHQQARRILVPPEDGVLQVSVKTDKPEYGPGDEAKVHVTALTPDGKPAEAQVTLAAFDKSVLYIQGETTPPIAKFFHGNVRHHQVHMRTNLIEQFSAYGYVHRPFQQLYPQPPAWHGVWGPTVRDWRNVTDDELDALGGELEENEKSLEGLRSARRVLQRGQAGLGNGVARDRAAFASTAAPAPAGAPVAEAAASKRKAGFVGGGKAAADADANGDAGTAPALVEAEVRTNFADTAVWLTTLTTGSDGKADAAFTMPDNLTTWKVNSWAMTKGTRVGQADTAAVTTKNLLVRLQAPRFFMEYDEVVISANVHNYLSAPKQTKVSLNVPKQHLELIGDVPAELTVTVPADGEARIDWRVKVKGEGVADVTVQALTNEESDAMRMSFPVLVHGMHKQVATTGSMRPNDKNKTMTVELNVPNERRPELTQLEVQFAPSLVGAMLDALPYCLDYPYGCTEQTMSRFLPAVLTLKTLQNMGIKLEDMKDIRGRLAEIRRVEKGENRKIYGTYADSPVFDTAQMNAIVDKGRKRIASMQNGDGGWGWWSRNASSGYLTSYVLYALVSAQRADVEIDANMVNRGMNWLRNWEQNQMRKPNWSPHAQHAFVAYVLSFNKIKAAIKPGKGDKRPGDLIERLWTQRDKLNLYGKALLSLAMAQLGDENRARTVLQNIMQFKEENAETQVAWFRTPQAGWWYWWNNDIETNAWVLRAIIKLEPKSDVAPRLVKWLLNNRRNGYYWRSTRDTTLCVAAMSEFVQASGEGAADYTLTLDLNDGEVVKKVKINKDTFFTYDNRFVVEGVTLGGGKHKLKITKDGPGALYFNTYLRYFTKERNISASGHELKVARSYYRLEQIPYEVKVEGSQGQELTEKRLRYERIPVHTGDQVNSGDILQVELRVTSDNDYTYLAFEDMKPAGCEPVDLRSGGKGQEGFASYMELRDEKTVFFVSSIGRGEHLLRYRLRAEIPGTFHALPTKLFAMYVPELRANSDEHVIKIVDE